MKIINMFFVLVFASTFASDEDCEGTTGEQCEHRAVQHPSFPHGQQAPPHQGHEKRTDRQVYVQRARTAS